LAAPDFSTGAAPAGDRADVDLIPSPEWSTAADPLASDRLVGVVDLGVGRVLARWRGRLPQLLVGGCCDQPTGW
jgi:hypothetical protein